MWKVRETVEYLRRYPEGKEERRAIEKILVDDESEKEWMKGIIKDKTGI